MRTRALIDLSEELHDVDIFDITSPRKPRPIREYDMVESFPQVLGFGLYIFKYNPTHGDVERLSSRSCGMPR